MKNRHLITALLTVVLAVNVTNKKSAATDGDEATLHLPVYEAVLPLPNCASKAALPHLHLRSCTS